MENALRPPIPFRRHSTIDKEHIPNAFGPLTIKSSADHGAERIVTNTAVRAGYFTWLRMQLDGVKRRFV